MSGANCRARQSARRSRVDRVDDRRHLAGAVERTRSTTSRSRGPSRPAPHGRCRNGTPVSLRPEPGLALRSARSPGSPSVSEHREPPSEVDAAVGAPVAQRVRSAFEHRGAADMRSTAPSSVSRRPFASLRVVAITCTRRRGPARGKPGRPRTSRRAAVAFRSPQPEVLERAGVGDERLGQRGALPQAGCLERDQLALRDKRDGVAAVEGAADVPRWSAATVVPGRHDGRVSIDRLHDGDPTNSPPAGRVAPWTTSSLAVPKLADRGEAAREGSGDVAHGSGISSRLSSQTLFSQTTGPPKQQPT